MTIATFESDTFSLLVTWQLADGTPKDLSGATVTAFARGVSSTSPLTLVGSVVDGAAGETRVTAASYTFSPGNYDIQMTVTKDGITRTFEDRIQVKDSIKEAA